MIEATASRPELRARIVASAARLLQEQGPQAVTTRGVAEAAGVQAPTIYRMFGDKDGLLDAVAEHVMATYVSAKAEIVAAASVDDVDPLEELRSGWNAQIDFGLGNPAVFRLLSDPDRVVQSTAAQAGQRVLESRVHRIAQTGRLRVSEQRAADLIQAAGIGAIQTLLSRPRAQRDPDLADALFAAVLHQIITDSPERVDSGPKASAVTLRAAAAQLDMLSSSERQLLAEWLDRAIEAL